MTLLRQFMGWATASSRSSGVLVNFLGWRWRLWLGYAIAAAVIYSASTIALYLFFSRSLNDQLNEQLLTLAQAATPSLETVKTDGRESLDKELPWRSLFSQRKQSLEWFDPNGIQIAQEGAVDPKLPLLKSCLEEDEARFQQQQQQRTVTICDYSHSPDEKQLHLQGYIRASQSTQEMEVTLRQLRIGLVFGGIVALLLAGFSSVYLTQQALVPVRKSLSRLRQFTADASHELRNPLARISIATELLLTHSDQMHSSYVKKLDIIQTATTQMNRLVEDLLLLTRTDAPMSADQKQAILLRELLERLAEHFMPMAHTKGIALEAKLPANLAVQGNSTLLSRLFVNLLENAIKYTESGGRVSVSLAESRRRAIISVEDTGIGIPSEVLPYVFERFWRSEQVQTQQEGTGLGLAIAQAIARQHGGQITVSSQLGTGTCFRVWLPLAN